MIRNVRGGQGSIVDRHLVDHPVVDLDVARPMAADVETVVGLQVPALVGPGGRREPGAAHVGVHGQLRRTRRIATGLGDHRVDLFAQRIGAQIVDERSIVRYLVFFDAEVLGNDALNLFLDTAHSGPFS